MKLIKNISKDELFLDNDSIIFNIELYHDTPVFKMPSLPPSEYVFKTDMVEETENLNELSKGKQTNKQKKKKKKKKK